MDSSSSSRNDQISDELGSMDWNDDEQAGQAGAEEPSAGPSWVPPPLEELLEKPPGDHQMLLNKNELAGMSGENPKPFREDYKRQDDGQAGEKEPSAGPSWVPPPLEELLEIPPGDHQMLLNKNELTEMSGENPKPFRKDYKRQN